MYDNFRPKNFMALIGSDEAKVMHLWSDIESLVDEVQA
jgi:nicotinic acid mononucleotide adenylyltransferase